MESKTTIDWGLVAKYFSGEASEEEALKLNAWKNLNDENKKLFNKIEMDWKNIGSSNVFEKVDVDKAWNKLNERIHNEGEVQYSIKRDRIINLSFALRYAAIALVLITIGFFAYTNFDFITGNRIVAESNEKYTREIALEDGSLVYLAYNSEISYPKTFQNKSVRKVELKGKAFFDVTKDKKKPFIISSKDVEVEVVGTSFSVNSDMPDNEVEVIVETGKVKLKSRQYELFVDPGERGVVSKKRSEKTVNKDPNYLSWKTKDIVFYNDRFDYVIETIRETYNVDIRVSNESINSEVFTATFSKMDIESVIRVICKSNQLKYDIVDDVIVLSK